MPSHRRDEHGEYVPPIHGLTQQTVIHDRARNRQVMRINGVFTLPIGAEVELTEPDVNAVVVGVRLLAGTSTVPPMICLDVEVPGEY